MNLSTKPQPKSWAISVRCRSKGLDFRMNAANILPNWGNGGERISLFLRLKRMFLLRIESEFGDPSPSPTRNLDLKKKGRLRRFCGSLGKLFGRWRKGRSRKVNLVNLVNLVKGKECGNSIDQSWCKYQTSLIPVMGSLSLLSYSSTQRDHKGILIHAFSYIFYLVSFFKISRNARVSSFFILILFCIAGLYFSYLNYGGFISKAAYLVSNWMCSLAFIYLVFSKLISSNPPISIERRRMKWCLLITSMLVLLYKLRREIPSYLIRLVFYSSRAWISGLLLTTQAIFQNIFESKGKNHAFGALLSSAYFWGKEMANYLVPSLQVYIPKNYF
ncbi:uncharacterized protein LOC144572635 [Carex rostrata]